LPKELKMEIKTLKKSSSSGFRKSKKGQEEMVGFILIIVMFIVMGMALLFLMKPKLEAKKDLQAQNLLNSMLESTEGGKKVRDIIEDCTLSNLDCSGMHTAVKTRLNSALSGSGLVLNRTLKGYSLSISTKTGSSLNITNGTLMGNMLTAITPISTIDVVLRFYY